MTMVAAWISALTGVGPAMASGSQVCSGSWADLPSAPPRISSAAATATAEPGGQCCWRQLHRLCWMSSVPRLREDQQQADRSAVSPTRVTMNALRAARAVGRVAYQKPMSR